MASLEKTIEVVLAGKVDASLDASFGSLTKQISGLNDAAQQVASPFAKLTDSLLNIDKVLAAVAVGGMAVSIVKAGEFAAQLSEINTIAGLSGNELSNFEIDVKSYASESTQSIENISKALYNAASINSEYAGSVEILRTTEQLAVGGKADLNTATEALLSTMAAYGAGTEEANKYSDAFFTTIKYGKTTLPELSASLSQATGIASSAKIPFETLGSAIAGLTASGVPTSQAMTQIRAAIQGIVTPSSEGSKVAESLGISLGQAAIDSKGLPAVLKEIYEKTGGSLEKILELIPSVEGAGAALVLGADKSGAFSKALEGMKTNTGATTKAFQEMENDLKLVFQNMVNNFNLAFISFGLNFKDLSADAIGGMAKVAKAISDGVDSGAFDPVIDIMKSFGRDAVELFEKIAENLPEALEGLDFDALIDSIKSLGETFKSFTDELFGDIDLTTTQGLTEALQIVVDTLTGLINVTKGMAEQFKPVWDFFVEGVTRVDEFDGKTQETFGRFLAGSKQVVDGGLLIFGAITAIKESGVEMSDVFDSVIGTIKALWNGLYNIIAEVVIFWVSEIELIVSTLQRVADFLGFDGISDKLNQVKIGLQETIDSMREDQVERFSKTIDGAKQAIDGLSGAAASTSETLKGVREETEKPINIKSIEQVKWELEAAELTALALGKTFSELPSEKGFKATFENIDETLYDVYGLTRAVEDIPENKLIGLTLTDAGVWVEDVNNAVDAVKKDVPVALNVDPDALEKYLAELDSTTQITRDALKFEAEVEVAGLEAFADTAIATSELISDAFSSTGDTITGLFGELAGLDSFWDSSLINSIQEQIKKEQELREKTFELTVEQFKAQQKLWDAQINRYNSGEALINIDGGTLEPGLQMVLDSFIKYLGAEITETGQSFITDLGL